MMLSFFFLLLGSSSFCRIQDLLIFSTRTGDEVGGEASRDRTSDEDPLEPLFDALANGDSIILFPEGTRGFTGDPQPFKAGLYNLALKCPNVVLVPAWINNVQHVLPKGEVVPVPVLCSVTFGTPMQLEAGEDRRVFLERARSAVVALRDV